MNVITSLQNFSGTLPELFRDQHLQLFRQLRRTPKGHYRTACIVKLPPPPPPPNPLAGALPRRHHPALRRHLPHQDRGAQRQTRHPARRSRRYLRPTLTHPALDAVRGALATRPDPQGTRLARSRPTGRCLAPSATPPSTAATWTTPVTATGRRPTTSPRPSRPCEEEPASRRRPRPRPSRRTPAAPCPGMPLHGSPTRLTPSTCSARLLAAVPTPRPAVTVPGSLPVTAMTCSTAGPSPDASAGLLWWSRAQEPPP